MPHMFSLKQNHLLFLRESSYIYPFLFLQSNINVQSGINKKFFCIPLTSTNAKSRFSNHHSCGIEFHNNPEQIVILSRLFWQCYPRMYARFGKAGESPTKITLNIEDRGYGIAWNMGSLVHLHDGWLQQCPTDYDCITHELAHAIQNGWDGARLEYSDYIERYADACRYLYAFNNGEYNDHHWQLQTVSREKTRKDAARFPVWFDYQYSTPDCDLLLKYFTVCRSEKYPTDMWKDAWAEIFKGSALEGRDIEDVWKEYEASEFASLSTKVSENGTSPLLEKFDVRRYTL